MAKWSSPSAFRACPQLTQGPNLWSFLFPSLQDCTSSVKLVGDPSEPSWFSSASQNLVREGQGRCIFPWVTLAPPGSKQGTNSQSFDKSGCRNWRQEDKEGPFFFFFPDLLQWLCINSGAYRPWAAPRWGSMEKFLVPQQHDLSGMLRMSLSPGSAAWNLTI